MTSLPTVFLRHCSAPPGWDSHGVTRWVCGEVPKYHFGIGSSVALTLPKGRVVLVSSRRHLSCSSAVAQQWL